MLRPDEMATILELAKEYTDSQQLGRKKTTRLTFNGDAAGRPSFNDPGGGTEFSWVNISDTPISFSPETLKKIEITTVHNGVSYVNELDLSTIFIEGGDGGGIIFESGVHEQYPIAYVFQEELREGDLVFPKGVNVRCGNYTSDNAYDYISLIQIQTIHPIPAEYIPPLDRLILNGADGNQYALTITDGAISVAPVTT